MSIQSVLHQVLQDTLITVSDALHYAKRNGYILYHFGCVIAIFSFIGMKYDPWLTELFIEQKNLEWTPVARWISHWSDLPTGCLLFCMGLWSLGFWLGKISWKRVAIACLIAALLSGLVAQTAKNIIGRSRPHIDQQGFYFFHPSAKYHSFPSGHTACCFGIASTLSVVYPAISFPAYAAAGFVGWARIQVNAHHPTDVFGGMSIGIVSGWILGNAVYLRLELPRYSTRRRTQLALPGLIPSTRIISEWATRIGSLGMLLFLFLPKSSFPNIRFFK